MDLQHIRVERRDEHITDVVLDRPPVNALDEQFIAELDAVAGHLAGEGRSRVVVLTSAHTAFMVGADLNMMDSGWDHVRSMIQSFQQAVNRWEQIPAATIALLNGHALGAGCELALACDWRIMAEGSARIGLPEVLRGLIAAGGGTQRMARTVGRAKALDMCMRGRMVSAVEAERIGLVSQACSAEELRSRGDELAVELAALPPLTVAAIKRCILQGLDGDLAAGLQIEEKEMVAVGETHDAKEGVQSFLQKREPRFEGR